MWSGCCSVTQLCLTLQPHGLQHTRLPCPSPSPRDYSNSCPLSQWCHPTISSSVIPFSSRLQSSQHQGLFQWVSSSHQVAKVSIAVLQYVFLKLGISLQFSAQDRCNWIEMYERMIVIHVSQLWLSQDKSFFWWMVFPFLSATSNAKGKSRKSNLHLDIRF